MSLAYASRILGRKFGVYQKLVSSAPSYDPDAAAWFDAVASTGGTITTANKIAFNTAFLSMKSTTLYDGSSVFDRIYQGYFFVGQESITNGLVTPFGNYINNFGGGVNYNFTSYTKTGGLVGNGVNTYIDTQINNNDIDNWYFDDRFVYVNCSNTNQGGFRGPFGVGSSSSRKLELSGGFSAGLYTCRAYNDSFTIPTLATTSGGGGNGFGLISTHISGGPSSPATPNCYIASTPVISANGTPTASLVNSNLVLGACYSGSGSSLSYGNQNMRFAAIGYGIYGLSGGFDPQAFQSLDSIVATLISSLT
jgi:hypothetical protein